MKLLLKAAACAIVCAAVTSAFAGVPVCAAREVSSAVSASSDAGEWESCGTDLIRAADIAGIKFSVNADITKVFAKKGCIEVRYRNSRKQYVHITKQAGEFSSAPKGRKYVLDNGAAMTVVLNDRKITKAQFTAEGGSFTVTCASGLGKTGIKQVYDIIAAAESMDKRADSLFSLAGSAKVKLAGKEVGSYMEALRISGLSLPYDCGYARFYADKGAMGMLSYDESGALVYSQVSSEKYKKPEGLEEYLSEIKCSDGRTYTCFSADGTGAGAVTNENGRSYLLLTDSSGENPADTCARLGGTIDIISRGKGAWALFKGEDEAAKIVLDGRGGFTSYTKDGKKLRSGYISCVDDYGIGLYMYNMYDGRTGEFAGGFYFDSDTVFHIGNSDEVMYSLLNR